MHCYIFLISVGPGNSKQALGKAMLYIPAPRAHRRWARGAGNVADDFQIPSLAIHIGALITTVDLRTPRRERQVIHIFYI